MKNIGILELHFHMKFLYTMMRICKTKNTKVTVFTTKKIFSGIKTYLEIKLDFEIILKEDEESINNFLRRVEKICNERIDLLFINTIQTNILKLPHYLKFSPKSKMILTIHVVNIWLKRRFAFNPKHILRSIDATICMFLIRHFILPKFNAINVIYSPIKDFIKENTNYIKPVFTLPFNFYDENKKLSNVNNDRIKFIVPGLIETYRRDYDLTLNIFEELFEKYNNKISLYLVGEPKGTGGKRIIEKCEKLKQRGYNIYFSKEFINEEEYNKILTEGDIIFSPLNVKTERESGISEIYGKTEGSALPFEAIQYCKPLILPEEFNIIDELKSSTIRYKSLEDLRSIFINFIENENKVKELKKEAYKNSKNFSLNVLQKYFTNEILDKLDNI